MDSISTSCRIAVIGGGVAGLSAAWLLARRHQVTLFEQNDYVGGHTNTVTVQEGERAVPVDTGFIVFNRPNYPNLTALFEALGVTSRASDMSFGVSVGDGRLEYAGSSLATLFAQRGNLGSPAFLGMLADILRFNRACKARLQRGGFAGDSLGEFLDALRMGHAFRHHYLLPMAAAIWSCPVGRMLDFPAESLARFFSNHGLLNLADRPQWRTVVGGSQRYVQRMLDEFPGRVHTASPVAAVSRGQDEVVVELGDGRRERFDQAVIASHADQALAMLADPTPSERSLLSAFAYQPNRAVLHSDPMLMPRRRAVWSAWNYLAEDERARLADPQVSVTYWMNRLQGLDCTRDYFVSLNPLREPDHTAVHAEFEYHHPVFDARAMAAQQELARIQGRLNTWYCGSYFGYGFHEDALTSGIAVASALGAAPDWAPSPVPPDQPKQWLPLAARLAGQA